MPKLVGHFRDTPVYSDPNAPKGKIFFFDDFSGGFQLDARNRKQRVVDFIKTSYYKLMKKQYIFLGVVLLAVVAVSVLGIYKYNQQPKGVTITQAVHQRDAALTDLRIQKSLNANDQQAVTNLTADKTALTNQKTTLCAQIKAAKLVQPLCQ